MPTVLDVERLRFTFKDDWLRVEKWDESPTYRTGIEKVKGELDGRRESTKAMDLVGLHRTEGLFLIEAKDFRPIRGSGGAQPNAIAYGGRWKENPPRDCAQDARHPCRARGLGCSQHACA